MVAPPVPPKLSYKGRKEREEEERNAREAEEARRREEEEARAQIAREEAIWTGTRVTAPGPVAAQGPAGGAGAARPAPEAGPAAPAPWPAKAASPAPREPKGGAPALASVEALQYAESPTMLAMGKEQGALKAAGAVPAPERHRRPPRPPKSPDMRPVLAGFMLVAVGLSEAFWGFYKMAHAHEAGSGDFGTVVRWAVFSAGFSALVLGAFAVRGGLWSFRKERYDVVKWGAICGTICMWALWVPWVLGFAALLIVHRAKDEYYPHYDPARDAPGWARPPRRATEGAAHAGEASADDERPAGAATQVQ